MTLHPRPASPDQTIIVETDHPHEGRNTSRCAVVKTGRPRPTHRRMPSGDSQPIWSTLELTTGFHQVGPERRRIVEVEAASGKHGLAPHVTMHDRCWEPWVRTLVPAEIPDIDRDLGDITDVVAGTQFGDAVHLGWATEEARASTSHYLARARTFVSNLAGDGRGMIYMIG